MLNIHKIIDHCCGAPNPQDLTYQQKQKYLSEQLKIHKLGTIKPASVQKWLERGQIPGDWLVNLHILAKKQKKPLNLYDFIERDVKAVFG